MLMWLRQWVWLPCPFQLKEPSRPLLCYLFPPLLSLPQGLGIFLLSLPRTSPLFQTAQVSIVGRWGLIHSPQCGKLTCVMLRLLGVWRGRRGLCSGGEGGPAITGVCWLASARKVSLCQARKVKVEDGGTEPLTSTKTSMVFSTSGQFGMALAWL